MYILFKSIIRLLFITGFILASRGAFAGPTIFINFDNQYFPYMYGDVKSPQGLYPILLAQIFEHMDDHKIELHSVPWKRATRLLDMGTFGLAGLYTTPQRRKKYDFSDSFFEEQLEIFRNHQNHAHPETLKDLIGKKIALNSGWSYGEFVDAARNAHLFTALEVRNNEQSLTLVAENRVDYTIIDQLSAQLSLTTHPKASYISNTDFIITSNPVFIAFHKEQRMQELIQEFNLTLNMFRETGEYQKIINHFIKHYHGKHKK